MIQNQNAFMVAEVELSYKTTFNISERPMINSSKQAYAVLMSKWHMNRIELVEEFKIILLNTQNRVLAISTVSQGGRAGTVADPRMIFTTALKICAVGIILAHNHPSSNLKPSQDDLRLTNQLKAAGLLLEIPILDHLIITKTGYYSFGDAGLL